MMPFPTHSRGPLLALLVSTLVLGCASNPDCAGEPQGPIDAAFAPLDNAVGGLNQKLNDGGPDGDCRLLKSSEVREDY